MPVKATQETETKFELDAESFARLISGVKISKRLSQRNVYFDAGWRLADVSATFRLRLENDESAELTLKIPVRWEAGRRIMKELSVELTERTRAWLLTYPDIDVAAELPPFIAKALISLGVSELQYVGESVNERLVVQRPEGAVEIDRMDLPNGATVFEAEVESEDPDAHQRLVDWILKTAPDARPSTVSKFQRFRDALASSASANGSAPSNVAAHA